jgi:D-inositol-3-phosphate glycosyltransferase
MRFPGPPAWFQTKQLKRIELRPNAAMFTHGDAVRHFRDTLHIAVDEVPPGVDQNHFLPASDQCERERVRASLGISPDDFMIMSAGRLIDGKGYDFLIEAAYRHIRRYHPIKLVIAGDGPQRVRYERQANALGIASHVRFCGHLAKEMVARQLRATDVFALFSDYENYSNAALEAMASGIPVLASRVGGFPLQIQDGVNGYLIERRDFTAFHSRVEQLRGSVPLREALGSGAQRFASGFTWEDSARRVEAIYARVTGEAR